jgi:hypothetical protein
VAKVDGLGDVNVVTARISEVLSARGLSEDA